MNPDLEKKLKEVINIKINHDKLKEITKALINNIDSDIKQGQNKNDKLALFYVDINNKKYYYSYNKLDPSFNEIYNSFKIVNYRKAKRLLLEQIYE